MKIYTKTGDGGSTGLYGGERVAKNHPRVAAYGAVDEVNAQLGAARAALGAGALESELARLQNALFDVGADLATPHGSRARETITPIDEADVTRLEASIDRHTEGLSELKHFVLPGGAPAAAALHVARATARRAERETITLAQHEAVNEQVIVWLNRLSDLLFTLARVANAEAGVSEVRWRVKGRERPAPSGGDASTPAKG